MTHDAWDYLIVATVSLFPASIMWNESFFMSVDGKNIIEASMNWEENECYDDKNLLTNPRWMSLGPRASDLKIHFIPTHAISNKVYHRGHFDGLEMT